MRIALSLEARQVSLHPVGKLVQFIQLVSEHAFHYRQVNLQITMNQDVAKTGDRPARGSSAWGRRSAARRLDLGELRHVVAIAGKCRSFTSRGCAQVAREDTQAVSQHAMVEKRRRIVENYHVNLVRAEGSHQPRGQVRRITVVAPEQGTPVDEHRNVHVAVGLDSSRSLRPE